MGKKDLKGHICKRDRLKRLKRLWVQDSSLNGVWEKFEKKAKVYVIEPTQIQEYNHVANLSSNLNYQMESFDWLRLMVGFSTNYTTHSSRFFYIEESLRVCNFLLKIEFSLGLGQTILHYIQTEIN